MSYSVCILKEILRKYNAQKYWMDGKNILHCILILQCWFRLARDEEMLTATMIRFVEEPRFKMEISQDGHKRVTSTSNPFLCAADFFLQLGSCKEAVR